MVADLEHAGELLDAAEILGMGRAGGEDVGQELADGDPAAGHGVDQLGLDAVAGGEEAVLVEDLACADELGGGEAVLDLEADEALDEGDESRAAARSASGRP